MIRPAPDGLVRIEAVVGAAVGRGNERFGPATAGQLARAAASLAAGRPRVVIITGFPAPDPPAGMAAETDGPVGAVQLAAALLALGGSVRLLTDDPGAAVVAAAAEAAGTAVPLDVAPVPAAAGWSRYARWERSTQGYPGTTHAIAVERPGPSRSGAPRSMRGVDLSGWVAPLHRVFDRPDRTRIGIGDGGNELGLGALPAALVAGSVPHGALIHCVVGCDHPLTGGTSNWAAAGLVAALALGAPYPLRGRLAALLAPDWSRRVLERMVAAGAVDGVLHRRQATVDGLDWPAYAAPLAELAGPATAGDAGTG